jgi:hypothetical protein
MMDPMTHTKHPVIIAKRRPILSVKYPEQRAPRKDPPGIAAVMPPCTDASGLTKLISISVTEHRRYIPRTSLALWPKRRSTRSLVEVASILLSRQANPVNYVGRMHRLEDLHGAHRRNVESKEPTANDGDCRNAIDVANLIHCDCSHQYPGTRYHLHWAQNTSLYMSLVPPGGPHNEGLCPVGKQCPTTDHSLHEEKAADEAHTSLSEAHLMYFPRRYGVRG